VYELLRLPNNQLSATRGVGRGTAQAIVRLSQRPELAALRAEAEARREAPELFAPHYAGPATELSFVPSLEPAARELLRNAGVTQLVALAQSQRTRIERILALQPGAVAALKSA